MTGEKVENGVKRKKGEKRESKNGKDRWMGGFKKRRSETRRKNKAVLMMVIGDKIMQSKIL